MKTLLGILFLSSITFAHSDCESRAMLASRSLWSVNSGVAMKYLTANVQNISRIDQSRLNLRVHVNTSKQGYPQNVPYDVTAVEKDSANCFIENIKAIESYLE